MTKSTTPVGRYVRVRKDERIEEEGSDVSSGEGVSGLAVFGFCCTRIQPYFHVGGYNSEVRS